MYGRIAPPARFALKSYTVTTYEKHKNMRLGVDFQIAGRYNYQCNATTIKETKMKASVAAYAARELVEMKDDDCGIDCRFFKLSDAVGLKVYTNKNKGMGSFIAQKQLHKIGWAPDCWGLSEIKKGKVTYYAYFTEVAEVMLDRLTRQGKTDSPFWYSERNVHLSNKFERVLKRIAKKIGYVCVDVHLRNIGVLNGKLTIIDVGHWEKLEKTRRPIDNCV